jgi:hypothetical protein
MEKVFLKKFKLRFFISKFKENSGVRAFRQEQSRSSAKIHFRLRGNATEVFQYTYALGK